MSSERRRYEGLVVPGRGHGEGNSRKQGLPTSLKVETYNSGSEGRSTVKSESQGVDLSGDGRSSLLVKKSKKCGGAQFDYGNRSMRADASLMPPIRQTASIFKQPVTVIRTQTDGKVKSDIKHGCQDKPKQLFWEKRLEGLRACDVDGRELNVMDLPRSLKTIGAHIHDETVLQSVATALHLSSQPVTGQTSSKSNMEKNPGVFINPDQPLVQAMSINEDDIKRQEDKVLLARRKLKEALVAG